MAQFAKQHSANHVHSGRAVGQLKAAKENLVTDFKNNENLFRDIVDRVNEQHRLGYTADDLTGIDFFSVPASGDYLAA